MPRVPKLQDEENNDWTETVSENIDIYLSSDDNDGPDDREGVLTTVLMVVQKNLEKIL